MTRATVILYTEDKPPKVVTLIVDGQALPAKLLGSKQLTEGDWESTLEVRSE